ncbi:MAG: hypothetical protein GKS02_11640 [Alphaproteobacteria bacterium]|nr:hypothetical protein [Alphaproteobacteria bacterium]
MRTLIVLLTLFFALPSHAQQAPQATGGDVRIPLTDYTALLNLLANDPDRAPAAYAIGKSNVSVQVRDVDERKTAIVNIRVQVETFEDEWVLVPLLPPGTALRGARVDGKPVQLVERPDGLSWSTAKAGTFNVQLAYSVDPQRTETGYVLPLAVPRAAATGLTLTVPETGVDLSVVPSADTRTVAGDGFTRVTASVPATPLIVVSWHTGSQVPFAISRATYSGELREDALVWTGDFEVEIFGGGRITLPVMPNGVTLSDVRVDGAPSTVFEEKGFFATILQGRGRHKVQVAFQVPVVSEDGPPRASLQIPKIPVSRFDLVLPGRKAVTVNSGTGPGVNVVTVEHGDDTSATAFIPVSDRVTFSWSAAVPEDLRGQVRANASLYHAVHAEEGVLHAIGVVAYEITHGKTDLLELELPADAQVNRISAPAGGVSDWVVSERTDDGRQRIDVFLERPVSGEYLLEVSYERLLGGQDVAEAIAVPLLSARNVHRQRGMVALLSGPELSLEPVEEAGVTRVGENQLPSFVSNLLTMAVAHTFKYIDTGPQLSVNTVAPERKQGRFDAQVDTLVSLGDVTLRGAATVEIDVKSGALQDLRLTLPANINVLAVSGPSLRNYEVVTVAGDPASDGQVIELQFTREMEGQFRIDVAYERIMDREAPETDVPTLSVAAAEVEHGRIAIEALTAVEVRAGTVEQLSSLDINELPQQLVLKTTNPILLAYRYVNAQPPFKLGLKITRHKEIGVQVAAIERADYKSLITRDGLAVTTARLMVRNSRRQFLRLVLPPESQVWSVFVDGKPEKPAYATENPDLVNGSGNGGGDKSAVLIKMINSARGFPVEIVYATPVSEIDGLGTLTSFMPRPDMVVTHSRWDVFLPAGPTYQALDSTLDLLIAGRPVNPRLLQRQALATATDALQSQMGQPLRINVPTQGIQFAFEKLYANQSSEEASFAVRYVSPGASQGGLVASAVGALLVWLGIAALAGSRIRLPRRQAVAALGGGVAALAITIGYLGTSPVLAAALTLVIAMLWGAWAAADRWRMWRAGRLMG